MQTAPLTTSAQPTPGPASPPADAPPGVLLPPWVDVAVVLAAVVALTLAWRKRVIGPRAASASQRDVSFQPPIIWFAATLLGLLFTAFAAALAQTTLENWAGPPTTPRGLAAPMIATYLLGGIACLVLARVLLKRAVRRVGSPESVTLRPRDSVRGLAWFAGSLPVVLAASIAATLLHTLVTGSPPNLIAHDTLKNILERRSDPWTWGVILSAALGAPLVEEFVYRCFLQSALLTATRRAWLAITAASLLFTAVHMNSVPPHALAPLFVLSLCLGVAYERTRSITVPITMHVLFNAGNIAVALLINS